MFTGRSASGASYVRQSGKGNMDFKTKLAEEKKSLPLLASGRRWKLKTQCDDRSATVQKLSLEQKGFRCHVLFVEDAAIIYVEAEARK